MHLSHIIQSSNLVISQEDFILVEYDLFFNNDLCFYNKFCIDEERDLKELKEIISKFLNLNKDAIIYVCAYSYESINYKGEKGIYADSFWLDTKMKIDYIMNMFNSYKPIQPSDISLLKEIDDYNQSSIYLFSSDGNIVDLKANNSTNRFDNVKILYWD